MKVFITAIICTFLVLSAPEISAKQNVVCYYASWTVYRPGHGQFDINDIDTSLCTHLNFAFIGLNPDASINIIDPWESNDSGLKGFRRLVELKNERPDLKVLVSMGGWNEGSGNYSAVAANPHLRRTMVDNVLSFLEEWNFDGFDLDWEYPGNREGSDPIHDFDNYIALLTDLNKALHPKYLLTAAVAGAIEKIQVGYNVTAASNLLDLINVMVYDFHGHFEPYVGHLAPLYKSSLDTGNNSVLNVASGIDYWLQQGADPSKIIMGIATYGRCFTLENPSNTSLYAPVLGGGRKGPYTRQEGFLGYNEICEFHWDWKYYWDDEQKVPHRVSGDQWVGYEDARSIKLKIEFAKSRKLGGVMVWALDTDDFKNICGGGRYPLLTTINENLYS